MVWVILNYLEVGFRTYSSDTISLISVNRTKKADSDIEGAINWKEKLLPELFKR